MKYCKIYFLLLITLCLGSNAFAQNAKPDPRWRFEMNAGTVVNYFTNEQPQTGLNVGGVANLRLNYATSKHFGLYVETGYAGNGGSLLKFTDMSYLGFDPTITYKNVKNSSYLLHSLVSGMGLYYQTYYDNNWSLKIYAAPTFNVILGETEQYQKTGNLLAGVDNFKGIIATINGNQYIDKFSPYWVGYHSGFQFTFPLKNKNELSVDFRFNGGITPVLKDYSYIDVPGVTGDLRTESGQVTLGYTLPAFKKKTKTK